MSLKTALASFKEQLWGPLLPSPTIGGSEDHGDKSHSNTETGCGTQENARERASLSTKVTYLQG